MKTESKAIIFGRYSNIKRIPIYSKSTLSSIKLRNGSYLPLKPLSSISDEDAEILGKYRYKNPQRMTFVEIGKCIISDYLNRRESVKGFFELELFEIDFLRLKGYATPQTVIEDGKVVTYSVEELVSNETFKLI